MTKFIKFIILMMVCMSCLVGCSDAPRFNHPSDATVNSKIDATVNSKIGYIKSKKAVTFYPSTNTYAVYHLSCHSSNTSGGMFTNSRRFTAPNEFGMVGDHIIFSNNVIMAISP